MAQSDDLANLRHSCSHLLAAAVTCLWPGTKPTLGPAIEDGFYYDFDFGDVKISENDFPRIEKEMERIGKDWEKFDRREVSAQEARDEFKENEYKLELIAEFEGKNDSGSHAHEPITLYTSGDFTDLCRGGHVDEPHKKLKYFKLMSVAGAYWRGSEKNKMLTRIYGTAFATKKELDDHLAMLVEAKKRDHKKIGKELGLFCFSDLVGQGLPLWSPKGTLVRDLLDGYVWSLRQARGYQRVCVPHIAKRELYEKSGHWSKFSNELFKIKTREEHDFVMKPMNCPHHTQIFASMPRSYRDLPQRYAETTMVYRDEQTGELSGLSRVRSVTQDDAHVFCRKPQMQDEFIRVWDIIQAFYGTFGFKLKVRLSFHDPENFGAYLGTPDVWKEAEAAIEEIAKSKNADYFVARGEAAFYGPKMDFITKDSLGREWQVATIQLDMNMPERFDLYCVNEKGEHERIIMIHAAIMGSIERFTSVLIEHLAGAFPLWLAPVQVALLPIGEKHIDFAEDVAIMMRTKGIRVELDTEAKSVGAKIRHQTLQKVPYMGIMGDKEIESMMVSVRTREGKDLGVMSVDVFVQKLISDIENRT